MKQYKLLVLDKNVFPPKKKKITVEAKGKIDLELQLVIKHPNCKYIRTLNVKPVIKKQQNKLEL